MSYFIGPIPRQSALPPFEEIARQLLIPGSQVLPPDASSRIDGKVDGFNCDPDCDCPGCMMGFGCYHCNCQS